jgi:tripartite-type tricarboxylate transporter receptor subunit TctC
MSDPQRCHQHCRYEGSRTIRQLGWLLAAFAVAAGNGAVAQQNFPSKPVRMVVGFSAGSATDILARTVGQKMSESWGEQVVVDNRPSAGGTIAGGLVHNAIADGYTLLVVSNGHAVNATLYSKLPYDTIKDFAGVSLLANIPNVLVVSPSLGARSTRELIALAKSRPGQINYASAGIGSGTHLTGEMFKLMAGLDVVHVPYKGTPEALTETLSGRVQYFFAPIVAATTFVRDGRLLALAVSTPTRSPVLPDVPSVAESALPGFDSALWVGLLAPARTPRAIIDKLNQEVVRILKLPDVAERLKALGADPAPTAPEFFDKYIKSEVEKLGKVVKASGARVD